MEIASVGQATRQLKQDMQVYSLFIFGCSSASISRHLNGQFKMQSPQLVHFSASTFITPFSTPVGLSMGFNSSKVCLVSSIVIILLLVFLGFGSFSPPTPL